MGNLFKHDLSHSEKMATVNVKENGKTNGTENGAMVAVGKCAVCDQTSSMKCSNCTKAYYCSVVHQKQDWRSHKVHCHPFEVRRTSINDI